MRGKVFIQYIAKGISVLFDHSTYRAIVSPVPRTTIKLIYENHKFVELVLNQCMK